MHFNFLKEINDKPRPWVKYRGGLRASLTPCPAALSQDVDCEYRTQVRPGELRIRQRIPNAQWELFPTPEFKVGQPGACRTCGNAARMLLALVWSRFTALLSSLMRVVMNNVTTSTRFLRGGCDS